MALLPGKIYKLESTYTDDLYIGSTLKTAPERLLAHKAKWAAFQADADCPWYSAFQLLQHDDVSITVIEDVACLTIEELRVREQFHINANDRAVNCNKAFRTEEELIQQKRDWQTDNRDKANEACQKWRRANPEKAKAATAKWREEHKDEIKQRYQENYDTAANTAKMAKYRLTHKDNINKYKREQYQQEKDAVLAKTVCGCGGSYDSTHRSRHVKSVKHVRWVELIE